jgi:uncharacterized protein YacL
MKSRPAETGAAVAAAVSVLIAWLAHIKDATVIAAMAVVIGFVPAAITWLVTTTRKPKATRRRRPTGESGLTAVGLIVGILLGALMYMFLVWLGLPGIIAVVVAVLVCLVFAGAL